MFGYVHQMMVLTIVRLSPNNAITKPVSLGTGQSLKIILTATNGGQARKPDQAFLTIADDLRDLDESYPLTLKESGKGTVEIVRNTQT